MKNQANRGNIMDKISIVVPCYNVEDSVIRCISSIKNQTYENFEALITHQKLLKEKSIMIPE